jgi:excisionase family DNA binding protein
MTVTKFPKDRLLSLANAADWLVSKRTVIRRIGDEELPAPRLGKLIRIFESDLRAFVAQRRMG